MGYSKGTAIEIISPGDYVDTWGPPTNVNFERIDQSFTQYAEVAVSDTAGWVHDATSPDGVEGVLTWTLDETAALAALAEGTQGRAPYVKFTAGDGGVTPAPGGDFNVLIRGVSEAHPPRLFYVENATGHTMFFYADSGTLAANCFEVKSGECVPVITYIAASAANNFVTTPNSYIYGHSIEVSSRSKGKLSTGTNYVKLDGDHPSGTDNVALGSDAGKSLAGSQNTLIGSEAGEFTASADSNTHVGKRAGFNTVSGDENTSVGCNSLYGAASSTQSKNTAIGFQANNALGSGSGNVSVGHNALQATTSGDENVCIGYEAGKAISGRSKNILIGPNVASSNDTGGDSILIIDHEDKSSPDVESFIYGDMANDRLNFTSSTTGSHVKIQSTIDVGSVSNYHLQCFTNADAGSPTEVFRIDTLGGTYNVAGVVQALADYADMFEWADGNPDAEDRIGLSVVLDGEGGIRIATGSDAAEDVMGIVSGTACMVGNAAWNAWDKTFLKDDFGRPTDEPNPDYDESLTYVPRQDRPEWAIIGLTGRVHIRKGSPTHPSWRKIKNVSAVTEEWLVR